MKLEPVILAPRPKEPSVSTRRALLWMGMAFAGGTVLGGACGYTIGAATAGRGPNELAPSGNAELDEMRRLAVMAPIEELLEQRLAFLQTRQVSYPTDETLWRGVARIADAVLMGDGMADRRLMASVLIATIEQGPTPEDQHLRELVPRLQRLAK